MIVTIRPWQERWRNCTSTTKRGTVSIRPWIKSGFDPDQPRDDRGRWSETGAGAGSALTAESREEYGALADKFDFDVKQHDLGSLQVVDDYQTNYGVRLNRDIRRDDLSSDDKIAIAKLDGVIDGSTLTEPLTVYRGASRLKKMFGIDSPPEEPVDSIIGAEFSDKGFLSTSTSVATTNEFRATYYGATNNALFEIKLLKGQKALHMEKAGASGFEQEVLLPRNMRFRVTGVETLPTADFTKVHLEVIGETTKTFLNMCNKQHTEDKPEDKPKSKPTDRFVWQPDEITIEKPGSKKEKPNG